MNHSFFDVLLQIDIRSIMYFVNQQCNFLDNFEHILGRYAKQHENYNLLIPCLIAWGKNTLQSRHSSKYFGMNKGITSYTMVANHIPIQARIIGANEHESHYVFDILYNNTTNIKLNIHSTDTQGTIDSKDLVEQIL